MDLSEELGLKLHYCNNCNNNNIAQYFYTKADTANGFVKEIAIVPNLIFS